MIGIGHRRRGGGTRGAGYDIVGHGHAGVDESKRRHVYTCCEEGAVEGEDAEGDVDGGVGVKLGEEGGGEGR